MTENNPVYSPHVIDMLTIANEFCLFSEKAADYPLNDILVYYQKVLPMLYLKGTMLPEAEPLIDIPERFVREEQWESIFNDLREKLGSDDEFYFMDLNEPGDQEPWKGSLADNIADIYQSMKDFILLFQKNTYSAQSSAVSDLRNLFFTHWGERVIRAHQVVHHILTKSFSTEEEV